MVVAAAAAVVASRPYVAAWAAWISVVVELEWARVFAVAAVREKAAGAAVESSSSSSWQLMP